MKKIFATILGALLLALSAIGFAACKDVPNEASDYGKISVYMPDGAPALSMAKLMKDNAQFSQTVEYSVVTPSLIQTFVTGESPKADLCVLPVNAASKLLGTGDRYQMLGTVTHGNLFLLAKSGAAEITKGNLSSLVGKTVGIIKLADVPGLTFKLVLNDNDIEYNELGNDKAADDAKVNLKAIDATQVIPANSDCDYFVVPEPAATTKINATKGALVRVGSLQELYGGSRGYTQAVLVAKKELIVKESGFIEEFISALKENATWILDDNTAMTDVVSAVEAHLDEGSTPTFTAANLNKTVIENCAINFVDSKACKEEVNAFIAKLIKINAQAASTVSDDFYYIK